MTADTALTTTTDRQVIAADLDAAFADFLRLRVAEGDASPHTVRAYYTHVRGFVSWCDSQGIDPARATMGDLEAYRRHLIDSGYTRATVAVKLQAVERFYTAMQWRALRADNPAKGLRAPRDKTDKAEKVKFLPLPGLQRLLMLPEATTPTGARDRAAILLMALHGLRVSEVASLDIADVDLASEPVRVTVRAGKGAKQRVIYLTETMAEALRSWLSLRPGEGEALFVALDRQHWGQRLSVRNLRTRVDRYLEAAGLKAKGISCHSLRHSFATWAVFGGADLPAVSAALGHASVATTGVYARVADKIKQNPAAYVEKLLQACE